MTSRSSIFLALLALLAPAMHADTLSTWNGSAGNWSDPTHWTPAQVPNNNGSQSYSVTVPTGDAISLDTNPTVNALTLNGGLSTGYDPTNGQYTTLTVNRNTIVNGGISGNSFFVGWLDSLAVGGNLTNAGYIAISGDLSVAGNLQNSGFLEPESIGLSGFGVGGTLGNTGTVQWGSNDSPGGNSSLGGLTNTGSIFIANGTNIRVNPLNTSSDIPKSASWTIAGSISGAFDNLRSIEGTLDIRNAIVLGSSGSTIQNSGAVILQTAVGNPNFVANVSGNFSNSGTVEIGQEGQSTPALGPSTLTVAGTFTNQATGNLTVDNPPFGIIPSPGSLNAQSFVNFGTATFNANTTSSVLGQLSNSGILNVLGDAAGDAGKLTTGSVTTTAGLLKVWNTGGLLVVGSGALPAGFTGYYQFANGVFTTAGGQLLVEGPASLNGTLDIMLGSGFKPIGSTYTVLTADSLIGSFSDIEGLVFDSGAERYLLNYDRSDFNSGVTLTVEANTTPEPASLLLTALGVAALLVVAKRRPLRLTV